MSFLRFLGGAAKRASEREDQYRQRVWKNIDNMWDRYEQRKLIEDEEIATKKKDIRDNVKTLSALGVDEQLMYTGLNEFGEGFFDVMKQTLSNIEKTDTWKFSNQEQRTELLNTATNKLLGERSAKPVTLDQIMPALLPKRTSAPSMEDIEARFGKSPLGFDYSGSLAKSVQDMAGQEDPAMSTEGIAGLRGNVREVYGEIFTDRPGVGLAEGEEKRRIVNAVENAVGVGLNDLGDRVVTRRMQDKTEAEQKLLASELYNDISSRYRDLLSDRNTLSKTENQLLEEAIADVLKDRQFVLKDSEDTGDGTEKPEPKPEPKPAPTQPKDLSEVDNRFIEAVRKMNVPDENIDQMIAAIREGKTIPPRLFGAGVSPEIARTMLADYREAVRQAAQSSVAPSGLPNLGSAAEGF